MWLEIVGTATGVVAFVSGVTTFIKNNKMPLSERKSIRNIQGVLRAFVQDEINMVSENQVGYKHFTYKKKNFEIHIYAYETCTSVTLLDTELKNSMDNKRFFDFEYDPKTKELEQIKESSHYYKNVGHYEENYDLLKAFVEKVMSIDWHHLEQKKQDELKLKYRVDVPENAIQPEPMPALESFSSELRQLFDAYESCYNYVRNHPVQLDLEKLHILERDYQHVRTLCKSFIALGAEEKINATGIMKQCMEDKMDILREAIDELESKVVYEFNKITEIMKSNSR